MNRFSHIWLIAVIFLIGYTGTTGSQEGGKQPFRFVQTISLPNVKGRLDHMDVDVKRKRLFVAGLENGTLEVVDLQGGKFVRSIPGFEKPQGALYVTPAIGVTVGQPSDSDLRQMNEALTQHHSYKVYSDPRDITANNFGIFHLHVLCTGIYGSARSAGRRWRHRNPTS